MENFSITELSLDKRAPCCHIVWPGRFSFSKFCHYILSEVQKASLDSISNLLKYIHSLGDRTKDSILVEMKGDTKLWVTADRCHMGCVCCNLFGNISCTAVPLRIAIIWKHIVAFSGCSFFSHTKEKTFTFLPLDNSHPLLTKCSFHRDVSWGTHLFNHSDQHYKCRQ